MSDATVQRRLGGHLAADVAGLLTLVESRMKKAPILASQACDEKLLNRAFTSIKVV